MSLFSKLSYPKPQLFFLLFLTKVNQVQSGTQFATCLGADNYAAITSYIRNFTNYSQSAVSPFVYFCCPPESDICRFESKPFICSYLLMRCDKVAEAKFCFNVDKSSCRGFIGNDSITNNKCGENCPTSLDKVISSLQGKNSAVILCCNKIGSSCQEIPASEESEPLECNNNQISLNCDPDSNGWGCVGRASSGPCLITIGNGTTKSDSVCSLASSTPLIPLPTSTNGDNQQDDHKLLIIWVSAVGGVIGGVVVIERIVFCYKQWQKTIGYKLKRAISKLEKEIEINESKGEEDKAKELEGDLLKLKNIILKHSKNDIKQVLNKSDCTEISQEEIEIIKKYIKLQQDITRVTHNYFNGIFRNFTGGVGNRGLVWGPQTVNSSPQTEVEEQQAEIVHSPPNSLLNQQHN